MPTRKRSIARAAVVAVLLVAVAAGVAYFTAGRPPAPPAGTVSLPTPAPAGSQSARDARAPAPNGLPVAPRAKGS